MQKFDLITNITLDTVAIFLIACLILFIIGTIFYNTGNMKFKQYGFLILGIILVGAFIFSIYNGSNRIKNYNEINDIPILVEHGYELFIDGQKVDLQHINLENYTYEIKEEEKIIILTK